MVWYMVLYSYEADKHYFRHITVETRSVVAIQIANLWNPWLINKNYWGLI